MTSTVKSTNPGKYYAVKALESVGGGYLSLPPTEYKCDWNDYYLKFGLKQTKEEFQKSCLNIKVEEQLQEIKTNLPVSIGSSGFDSNVQYIVQNYIPYNSLCCIYGASGSYKSFLAVSIACHIATGTDWSNQKVKQGSVIYVVGEGGIGLKQRIKAWEIQYNQGKSIKNLYLINRPIYPISEQDLIDIINLVKELKNRNENVSLIVMDTLARCFGSSDENSTKDMNAFIHGCDQIKNNTNASILIIHHTGKDEEKGARGSSVLKAALDAEFQVKKSTDKKLNLICSKMKDLEEPRDCSFSLVKVDIPTNESKNKTSLCLIDKPQEIETDTPKELIGIKNLSENHVYLFKTIKQLTNSDGICFKDDLITKLKTEGVLDVKNLNHKLMKLKNSKVIELNQNEIFLKN